MANKPLVSVVIPTYNAEEFIQPSLNSILNQTYTNLEVIVIDDCSTDRTVERVCEISRADKRVRVLKNDHNLGIGGNRNKGIQEAKGKYICWQDADDISLPDRIESQVIFLEARPRVGIVGGYITFFSGAADGVTRRYAEDDRTLRKNIFKYNPVAQPACMVRRECFDRVGGYNQNLRLSEDLEMQFRIGEQYEFGNIQQVVLKYRQSPGSLTAANLKKMELATLSIRKRYRKNQAYRFDFSDLLYNVAQLASMSMPRVVRMAVFGFIRGDK